MQDNEEKKGERWDPEGDDAAYVCRRLLENPALKCSTFIREHSDWILPEGRYAKKNFQRNFANQVKRVEAFKQGKGKF